MNRYKKIRKSSATCMTMSSCKIYLSSLINSPKVATRKMVRKYDIIGLASIRL